MGTENSYVVQWLEENREDSYVSEVRRDRRRASIFMVPKTLKGNDAIYTPQVISMGPYHFLKPHLAEMESEKSKIIARAVMSNLPPHFFTPLQMFREGCSLSDLQEDNFFGRVVHGCKDCYGDAQFLQKLNEETFAMMMFRDASFLLVFLAHHVANRQQNKNGRPYQKQSHSDGGSPFHGLRSGKGLYLDVMKDVVKLENQIPLLALKALYEFIGGSNQRFEDFVAQICYYYSPFWIQPSEDSDLVSKLHLLHCIHATIYSKSRKSVGQRPTNGWSPFTWLKKHSLCVRGRNRNRNRNRKRSDKKRQDPTRLFGSNVLPSALKLSKAGVKFRHYEGGIQHIRFDRAQSTLYLPVLKIGIMTETIIRNLIAFELCSSESEENAVTSFVRLLEELTQGYEDAELLRKNGILVNWVGGDEKMVEIVRSLSSSTWKPYFKPVNDARNRLKAYYSKRTWKILWTEFVDTYCSKPWVLISVVESTAGHQQIRNAYRWLQKKCHPDVAGDDGHHMAILLNEAYSVLSDPNARYAYDQVRAERMEVQGYTGQPLYSKWFGPAEEDRAIFVDEMKCVGCLKCALVAPKTFAIETDHGRARAIGQWAESEETVSDAIQACPVDCISLVERDKLPALEFLMSKQPRVAVRMNANNSAGARVINVFADAERFLEKLRKKKDKVSKFQESPAQRESRMAAAQQIRTSAGWWWHRIVGDKATEYTNHQRASKGAIVPLNWEQRQQFSVPVDSDETNNSKGSYKYQRIHISQQLSEAAARRREGKSTTHSKHPQVASDGDYWVPVTPEKSSVVQSPTNNLDSKRIFSVFPGERYNASSVGEEEKTNMELGESRMEGDWRKIIMSGIPFATSAAGGLIVGFGSEGGQAGGLETHLAGPLALKVINSFEMHILQAATFWYVVGILLSSVITAVVSVRKKL